MTAVPGKLSIALADRYRIERELGQGGMATVYLAEDLKHKRHVALKVLKPELAAVLGAERFVQEITTTAALQHPHILPLFDSGTADGFLFYVMPYIDGETLRSKLDRETQLGIEEAVQITRDVASALDYAHRHNVIHRDIKPENILLHEGRPMVADFGIALAVSAAAGGRMTETGMSLGTPHYMSPEQATAEKEISARSDIYSLASVLYEMLTGNPPHTGASAQQIIMKIVTEEAAPVTRVRKTVPPNVAAAVAQSLEKLPADRFESAAKFAEALADPHYTRAGTQAVAAGGVRGGWNRMTVGLAALAAVALGLAGFLALNGGSGTDNRMTAAVIPLEIRTPSDLPLNQVGSPISIAPDGSFLVFVGPDPDAASGTAIWRRGLDRIDPTVIPGTSGGQSPEIMPDGRSVQFYRRAASGNGNDRLEVGLEGELPTRAPIGLMRLRDGRVLVGDSATRTVELVSAAAAAARDGSMMWRFTDSRSAVDLTTDGRWVARRVRRASVDSIEVGKVGASDASRFIAGTSARFLDDVTLAFRAPDGTLQVGRLRDDRTGFVAAPIAVVPSVSLAGNGSAIYAVGDDGTLVYVSGASVAQSRLVWVSGGREQELPNASWRIHSGVRLSPDGRRAALTIGALLQSGDIWVADLALGSLSPLTTDGVSTRAAWTPEGRRISYVVGPGQVGTVDPARRRQIFLRAPDSGAPADTLTGPWGGGGAVELDWSPDGRYLAVRGGLNTGTRDVFIWTVGTDSLRPIAAEAAQERGPRISPDGEWLIYVSDRSGRDEVYAEAMPAGGNRVQISAEGGREGVWSRDGSQVFYRGLDRWMTAATLARGAELSVTGRTRLFDASPYLANQFLQMYDVAPDGRFLMFKLEAEAPRTDIVIIRNWVQQVKERLKGATP